MGSGSKHTESGTTVSETFFLSECDWQPATRPSVEELWAGFNEQAEEYDQVGGPEDSDGTEQ